MDKEKITKGKKTANAMNGKKVALMTWYTYRNYGTALQASALYKKTEDLGYTAQMVKYPPKTGARTKQRADFSFYFRKLRRFLTRNPDYATPEREKLFSEYLSQRITETPPAELFPDLQALNDEFDAFLCGSDQIWSPHSYDEKYFLSFVENPEKMAAYAPSFGAAEIKDEYIRAETVKQLNRFIHLSVREKTGAALIRELTGKEAKTVLDPTLLLNGEEWIEYANVRSAKKPEGEYILCYFLGEESVYAKYAQALAAHSGLPIYTIPTKQKGRLPRVPFEVGPSEFVSLIKNAKYVCTDSFHGLAFSVIFNRDFTVFKRFKDNDPKNQNSRVLDFLKLLGLEDRLKSPSDKAELSVADFTQANERLCATRAESLAYLEDVLRQTTGAGTSSNAETPYVVTGLCCGCGACASVCPQNAIVIERNEKGFDHYEINKEKCVRCGLCRKVCPFRAVSAPALENARGLYAVKHGDLRVLQTSSSGGVGHALAEKALSEGATVFGCVYEPEKRRAKHISVRKENQTDLPRLQGSKYVQSSTAAAFAEICALPEGEKIVFFGTPCQVAGLDKLLVRKGRRADALLVDLICHGVPSAHLFEKHLHALDGAYRVGETPEVNFRAGEWRNRALCVQGKGKSYIGYERKDDFYAFFRRGLCDMETCFECPYRERSAADLRLGDYWGDKFQNDRTGVSMVVAETPAGEAWLQALKESGVCNVRKEALEEYWSVQYPYNARKPAFYSALIAALCDENKSLSELRKEYCAFYERTEKTSKLKNKVKRILKKGKGK